MQTELSNSYISPCFTKPWNDPNEKAFVSIKGVTRHFGDVYAVDDVSLDIYKGELFCLLGGSGSGKSTLLRMLAGFETPDLGHIEIDGQEMSNVPAERRPTNMMFQSYALFPHMNVFDNVAYGLRRDGIKRQEIKDRVEEILKLVQLQNYGKRRPHQLSGGQQQRVALARSLIKKPKLLLLDEPLGALDKKLRTETQFELVNIQEKLGVTFIVVTHDQEEAMTLASRIGVMRNGKIEQIGTPGEIYEFPNSRFVADFIGTANILEGIVIEDHKDNILMSSQEFGGNIYVGHGVTCVENQKMWYAIRPEKIFVAKSQKEGVHNQVKGKIEDIAYLGNISIFRVKLDSGKMIQASMTNKSRHGKDELTWGDEVYLSWLDDAGVVLSK